MLRVRVVGTLGDHGDESYQVHESRPMRSQTGRTKRSVGETCRLQVARRILDTGGPEALAAQAAGIATPAGAAPLVGPVA